MSMQAIPNSGPFNDPLLDNARSSALMAIDAAQVELPTDLIDYMIWLEQRHLDLSRQHKAAFLRESWEARKPKTESGL